MIEQANAVKSEENNTYEISEDEYSEIKEIFPALQKYKSEHSKANLQKLCVEIVEFCRSVYASTQNEQEREIYRAMLGKLNI